MYGFFETVSYEAWRSERERPAIVVIWHGRPKLSDVAILAQALLPGQVLRVAADARWMLEGLEVTREMQDLNLVGTNEDRVLTWKGCYAHYYADFQRSGASK